MKQTDAVGEYVLDTLSPGSQELTVRKQGYVSRSITVNVEVGKEVRGDVELSRGRDLHGRVIDAEGKLYRSPGAFQVSVASGIDPCVSTYLPAAACLSIRSPVSGNRPVASS